MWYTQAIDYTVTHVRHSFLDTCTTYNKHAHVSALFRRLLIVLVDSDIQDLNKLTYMYTHLLRVHVHVHVYTLYKEFRAEHKLVEKKVTIFKVAKFCELDILYGFTSIFRYVISHKKVNPLDL